MLACFCRVQTFAGQDEWMEELLGDEYYVELFAEIAESEPITEAIDEVDYRAHRFTLLCSTGGLRPSGAWACAAHKAPRDAEEACLR